VERAHLPQFETALVTPGGKAAGSDQVGGAGAALYLKLDGLPLIPNSFLVFNCNVIALKSRTH